MSLRWSLIPAALAAFLIAVPAVAQTRAEALIARAHAAAAKGRFDDATMLAQAAIVADPARTASYVALARLYAAHGHPHFAHKYFDEALYLDPSLPDALEGAGRADLALGDRAAARDKLARLTKACGDACPQAEALKAALEAGKNDEAAAQEAPLDKE